MKGIDWNKYIDTAEVWIKEYARKAGRVAARPLLQWWYVMQDEKTSVMDKALIYGAIAYIIIPSDLLPRRVLHFIGVLDDVAVATWLTKKVSSMLTDQIRNAVEEKLDEWFGCPDVLNVK
ncbi:MAG: DUF1232 domain-containing protein [Bacteroidales bacterium]|nr:DUF1232 domain-containing protein [Bacteroidales bacterium]